MFSYGYTNSSDHSARGSFTGWRRFLLPPRPPSLSHRNFAALSVHRRHLALGFLLNSQPFNPGFLEYVFEPVVVDLGHLGRRVLHPSMLDRTREHLCFGRSFVFPEERFDDEIDHIASGHVTEKSP